MNTIGGVSDTDVFEDCNIPLQEIKCYAGLLNIISTIYRSPSGGSGQGCCIDLSQKLLEICPKDILPCVQSGTFCDEVKTLYGPALGNTYMCVDQAKTTEANGGVTMLSSTTHGMSSAGAFTGISTTPSKITAFNDVDAPPLSSGVIVACILAATLLLAAAVMVFKKKRSQRQIIQDSRRNPLYGEHATYAEVMDDVAIERQNAAYSFADVTDDANPCPPDSAYSLEETSPNSATDYTMKENIIYGNQ